jgi:hypothetical protein
MQIKFLILFLLIGSSFDRAMAFPQMIRHGYTSCNTCHASPRGGGIMTDYGRALSKELLSTWSYEGEEKWHYGALNEKHIPKWFKVGGDFRALQVHSKDDVATIGRFIRMQDQVELAAKTEKFWFSLTAATDRLMAEADWYIPGFYALANLTESLSLRLGKFVPRFGINTPEHIVSTRSQTGFGLQAERETLELSYILPKWDISVSLSQGELRNNKNAEAVYIQANYSFGTKDRIGLSFEKKNKDDEALSIGLHGLVGFSEKLYLVSDTVFRNTQILGGGSQDSIYHYSMLGYEIEKGLHLIAIEDIQKQSLSEDNTTKAMYGLGFNFFPRPHIELQGIWTKRLNRASGVENSDYAWFLMHYYL